MLRSALMGAHVRFSKAASLSAQQTDGGGRNIVVHVVFAAMGGPDVLHHLWVEVGVEVAENANVDAEDGEVFVLHLHVLAEFFWGEGRQFFAVVASKPDDAHVAERTFGVLLGVVRDQLGELSRVKDEGLAAVGPLRFLGAAVLADEAHGDAEVAARVQGTGLLVAWTKFILRLLSQPMAKVRTTVVFASFNYLQPPF